MTFDESKRYLSTPSIRFDRGLNKKEDSVGFNSVSNMENMEICEAHIKRRHGTRYLSSQDQTRTFLYMFPITITGTNFVFGIDLDLNLIAYTDVLPEVEIFVKRFDIYGDDAEFDYTSKGKYFHLKNGTYVDLINSNGECYRIDVNGGYALSRVESPTGGVDEISEAFSHVDKSKVVAGDSIYMKVVAYNMKYVDIDSISLEKYPPFIKDTIDLKGQVAIAPVNEFGTIGSFGKIVDYKEYAKRYACNKNTNCIVGKYFSDNTFKFDFGFKPAFEQSSLDGIFAYLSETNGGVVLSSTRELEENINLYSEPFDYIYGTYDANSGNIYVFDNDYSHVWTSNADKGIYRMLNVEYLDFAYSYNGGSGSRNIEDSFKQLLGECYFKVNNNYSSDEDFIFNKASLSTAVTYPASQYTVTYSEASGGKTIRYFLVDCPEINAIKDRLESLAVDFDSDNTATSNTRTYGNHVFFRFRLEHVQIDDTIDYFKFQNQVFTSTNKFGKFLNDLYSDETNENYYDIFVSCGLNILNPISLNENELFDYSNFSNSDIDLQTQELTFKNSSVDIDFFDSEDFDKSLNLFVCSHVSNSLSNERNRFRDRDNTFVVWNDGFLIGQSEFIYLNGSSDYDYFFKISNDDLGIGYTPELDGRLSFEILPLENIPTLRQQYELIPTLNLENFTDIANNKKRVVAIKDSFLYNIDPTRLVVLSQEETTLNAIMIEPLSFGFILFGSDGVYFYNNNGSVVNLNDTVAVKAVSNGSSVYYVSDENKIYLAKMVYNSSGEPFPEVVEISISISDLILNRVKMTIVEDMLYLGLGNKILRFNKGIWDKDFTFNEDYNINFLSSLGNKLIINFTNDLNLFEADTEEFISG